MFVVLEKGLFETSSELVSHEVDREFLRTAEYRKWNPDGLVPTLVVDGEPLVESSVIMRFLDERFGATLQPAAPLERAQMNLWLELVDLKYFPSLQAVTVAVFMRRMFGTPPDETRLAAMLDSLTDHGLRVMREDTIRRGPASPYVDHGLAQLKSMLDRMESTLQKKAFLAGASLSLADCALTPLVLRLEEFGLEGAWAERPHVAAWWAEMNKRPSVERLVGLADQALLTELTSSIGEARPHYLAKISG